MATNKIEEKINPRTGLREVFLNGSRLEDIGDDQTALLVEIVKMLEDMPSGESDCQRNIILEKIAEHLGAGNNSLQNIKSVLINICDKIGEGSSEEIDRVKEELLLLIQILDQKIEQSKLVAGEGIIIEGNVISTTKGSYVDKLIDDYEKLKQQYDLLLKRYNTLQSEYSKLQVEYSRLEELKENFFAQLKELEIKYENSLVTISNLEKEVKRLEEIIASGEDHKLYEEYRQMYMKECQNSARWRKEYESMVRIYRSEKDKHPTVIWKEVPVCRPCCC